MKFFKQYSGLKREIYVLAFGKVVTCMGEMVWPMMTLILSNQLDMDASSVASLLLIMNIIQVPCMLFAGYLTDRYNKRNCIIFCDLVTVISYVTLSFLDINMYTISLFFVAGLFAMMERPAYDALIADLSQQEERQKAYSLCYLGANLGMILSPVIGGFLFTKSLTLMFLIDGLSTLVSTILIFMFIKDVTPIQSSSSNERVSQEPLWKILFRHHFITYCLICYVVIEVIYSQYQFLIPLNLEQLYGASGAMIYGSLCSLNAFLVVLGTPILTMLFYKVKDIDKIMISSLLFSISLSMFIFVQGMIPLYFVSIFIFTCGEIFNALGKQPYLTKHIPINYRGRIFSLERILATLMIAFSQKGIGFCIDHYTIKWVWTLVSFITIIGIMMIYFLKYLDKRKNKNGVG